MAAQQQDVGFMKPVDGGGFRAVDLGPFMTEAIPLVPLGKGGSFPDPCGPGFKVPDNRRPVVDL